MKDKYDVVIIGAGIGGLVCGCYLAKAGLKVLIVEKNDKPGGYCTSFEMDGYRFDVGPHYLGGIKRGALGKILEELEVKDQIKFHQFDPTDKIVISDKITYIRVNFLDTLREFKKSFPKDKKDIESFFKFIMQPDFNVIYSKVKGKAFKEVLDEYFENKLLKQTLSILLGNMGTPPNKASALSSIILFKEFILDPGYYPVGGIQVFSDTLLHQFNEKKYTNIIFLKKATEVLVDRKNRVLGVLLDDGQLIHAKTVVYNGDATQLFKHLIKINCKEKKSIKNLLIAPSAFMLYLGIERGIESNLNPCIWYVYKTQGDFILTQKEIEEGKINFLLIFSPSFHDPLSKKNKFTLEIFTIVPYISKKFWEKREDIFSQSILEKIEKIWRINNIKVIEKATPVNFYEHTFSQKGSIFGWMPTPMQSKISILPQNTSIYGLFITGHWCTMGSPVIGVGGVALSGRRCAELMFPLFKKKWRYTKLSI